MTDQAASVSLDAETCVLGAMLLSTTAVREVRAALVADDFWRGAHRTVFDAACRLADTGQTPDPVTVSDELSRRGQLDDAGGPIALMELVERTPTAANALHYATIVADLAYDRRVQTAAARLAAAAADPTVDTAAAVADHETALRRRRTSPLRVLSSAELDTIAPPPWLIDGHVPEGLTMLYGPSNTGKTFVALSWACSIAATRPWFGSDVAAGPVVYVYAEGASTAGARVRAWRQATGGDPRELHVVPEPVSLLDPRQLAALSDVVGGLGARLVVIDTLARCYGGDENSTDDMGRFVAACDRLRVDHGCSVVVVHHTGNDRTRARGNTSLFAACDAVVRCTRTASGMVELDCDKAKDAEPFRSWYLTLQPVGPSVSLELQARSAAPRGDRAQVLAQVRNHPAPVDLATLRNLALGDQQLVADLQSSGAVVQIAAGPHVGRWSVPEQAGWAGGAL